MDYLCFAKSESHQGMVKIGRTDRSVRERMYELSNTDYGETGFEGDSTWKPVGVLEVEDNVKAESLLHYHFDNLRVEEGREIFSSSDINGMVTEGAGLVHGNIIDLPRISHSFASDEEVLEIHNDADVTGIGVDTEEIPEVDIEILDGDSIEVASDLGLGLASISVVDFAATTYKHKDKKICKRRYSKHH